MKHFYKICSLFLVISCGGGGASSPEAVIPPTQNIPPQPLFKESPIRLIDAASYYSQACNNPSFQFLIPTKINDDGFIDFIAHFWCDSITPQSLTIRLLKTLS